MRAFKVKAGSHFHDDGKEYVRGDVVLCERDLCARFRGKFEEVLASANAPAPSTASEVEQPGKAKSKRKPAFAFDDEKG